MNAIAIDRLESLKTSARKKALKSREHKNTLRNSEYQKSARKTISSIRISPEISQIFCSLLYWAEGGKYNNTRLEFTNSDPRMIHSFLKFLRKGFDIDEAKFRANIHIHEYHNEKKQIEFWHNVTEIPYSQFNRSYIKSHTGKVKRENYQGCVRICYYSADIAHKIHALYKSLAEIS